MGYTLYEIFFKKRKSSCCENIQKNKKNACFWIKLTKPARMRQKKMQENWGFYKITKRYDNFFPPPIPIPLSQRLAHQRRAQELFFA
jgi:hypothetical protein